MERSFHDSIQIDDRHENVKNKGFRRVFSGFLKAMAMCGRMIMDDDWSELKISCPWVEIESLLGRQALYNIAPTDTLVTVNADPAPKTRRWGLVPHWSKQLKGRPLINARVETVDKKPTFRSAFAKHRCLVPVSGFYEWQSENGKKQPYLFRGESKLLFMAGITASWTSPEGEKISSFAVITGPAKGEISEYHDRMPKILAPTAFQAWLSSESSVGDLYEILQEESLTELFPTKVSTRVNNVRHKDAACAEAI